MHFPIRLNPKQWGHTGHWLTILMYNLNGFPPTDSERNYLLLLYTYYVVFQDLLIYLRHTQRTCKWAEGQRERIFKQTPSWEGRPSGAPSHNPWDQDPQPEPKPGVGRSSDWATQAPLCLVFSKSVLCCQIQQTFKNSLYTFLNFSSLWFWTILACCRIFCCSWNIC